MPQAERHQQRDVCLQWADRGYCKHASHADGRVEGAPVSTLQKVLKKKVFDSAERARLTSPL